MTSTVMAAPPLVKSHAYDTRVSGSAAQPALLIVDIIRLLRLRELDDCIEHRCLMKEILGFGVATLCPHVVSIGADRQTKM